MNSCGFLFGGLTGDSELEARQRFLVSSFAGECLAAGAPGCNTYLGIACERLALAIAFVFGPDGHDVGRLHGEKSPVCLFNARGIQFVDSFFKIF